MFTSDVTRYTGAREVNTSWTYVWNTLYLSLNKEFNRLKWGISCVFIGCPLNFTGYHSPSNISVRANLQVCLETYNRRMCFAPIKNKMAGLNFILMTSIPDLELNVFHVEDHLLSNCFSCIHFKCNMRKLISAI